jgi:hypothetical protein
MSKISLAPDASGTGIFTIASPGTSTNRTLTLPDDTGTIVTNSGNQAGSFTTLNTSGAVVFNDAGADVDFRVEGDTDANLLFVDASADKVGIGTSSPSYKVHSRSGNGNVALTNAGTYPAIFGFDNNGNAEFFIIDGYDLRFQTNGSTAGTGTERARITNGGFFMASNTGTYSSPTQTRFEFASNVTDFDSFMVKNSSASPYGQAIKFSAATPNNTTNFFLSCSDSTNSKAIIYSDGSFQSRANSYGGISDVKLKQDIIDAGSQWDDIKGLRVVKYRFKDEVAADPNYPLHLGVIAQEAELVSPGLVFESPDFENVEVPVLDDDGNPVLDEDGNPQVTTERQATGTVTKGVKYSVLYMKAVKALQEAIERIETLEASNTALEARIAALEGQ